MVALAMLAHLLDDLPIAMEILVRACSGGVGVVGGRPKILCRVLISHSSSSKTRYLVRGFAQHCPSCESRWDDGDRRRWRTEPQTLLDAGANHVASVDRVGTTSAASWRCRAFQSPTPRAL
jgi:hypothetical protein